MPLSLPQPAHSTVDAGAEARPTSKRWYPERPGSSRQGTTHWPTCLSQGVMGPKALRKSRGPSLTCHATCLVLYLMCFVLIVRCILHGVYCVIVQNRLGFIVVQFWGGQPAHGSTAASAVKVFQSQSRMLKRCRHITSDVRCHQHNMAFKSLGCHCAGMVP